MMLERRGRDAAEDVRRSVAGLEPPAPERLRQRSRVRRVGLATTLVVLSGALVVPLAVGRSTPQVQERLGGQRSNTRPQEVLSPMRSPGPQPAAGNAERSLDAPSSRKSRADASQPAASASGDRLAYSRDGVLLVTTLEGDLVATLGPGYAPSWSPDGTRIVAVDGDRVEGDDASALTNVELFVVAADGSGRQALTSNDIVEGTPAWSPDGSWIAFSRSEVGTGLVHVGRSYIALIRPDGSGERRLADGMGSGAGPSWSPDGSRVAFAGSDGLYVVDADGGNLQRIVADQGAHAPAWSPDGTAIAFSRRTEEDVADIWLVSPDGSGLRELTSGPEFDTSPAWTPDGGRIAFVRDPDGVNACCGSAPSPQPSAIYLMDDDGENVTRFTPPGSTSPEHGPAFAPSHSGS